MGRDIFVGGIYFGGAIYLGEGYIWGQRLYLWEGYIWERNIFWGGIYSGKEKTTSWSASLHLTSVENMQLVQVGDQI